MRKIIALLIFLPLSLFGQNEGKVWYFGHYAGLDFCSGSPVVLTDGMMDTKEGCASIADKNCGLLFYTDGITVWNRQHSIMPNGTGLMGDSSATQSGVIVPLPGNDKIYYLFTVDDNMSSNGLRYSIVDMSLDGGLGDISQKNILLLNDCTEKITSVKHANGQDIWVIAHEFNSNAFRIWLLTESGFNDSKSINVGYVHQGTSTSQNKIGYLTVSPDGKRIALAVKWSNLVEIFDFDDTTGEISNPITIQGNPYAHAYGVGFSPDGKRLYVTTRCAPYKFHQFNLEAGSGTDIINSSVELARAPVEIGAVQAGPDGKMYISLRDYPYLAVINKPSELGTACDLVLNGVYLEGRTCGLGLPTFIQTYFKPDILLSYNGPICEGEDIELFATFVEGAEYYWSGPDNFFSTDNDPVITDAKTNMSGPYELKVIFPDDRNSFFYNIIIIVHPKPEVSIIPSHDTTIFQGTSITLSATPLIPENSYSWSTGETGDEITVDKAGIYTVYAENEFGCIDSFSVEITVADIPDVNITTNRPGTLCEGDTVILSVNPYNPVFNYYWSTGETGGFITVTNSGTYSVSIESPVGLKKKSEIFIVQFDRSRLAVDQRYLEIDFGQINFIRSNCESIKIINISDERFDIENIYIKNNISFSIPQSQFIYSVEPGDTADLLVCFSPNFLGLHRDTLIIGDTCASHIIPLEGIGIENTYYGNSDCNVKLKMKSTELLYFNILYPYPSFGLVKVDLGFRDFSNLSISIYNIIGNRVYENKEYRIIGEYCKEIDVSGYPPGIYFVRVETGREFYVKKLVVY
jgi:hypothetical protein